jgi:hypothetical protein
LDIDKIYESTTKNIVYLADGNKNERDSNKQTYGILKDKSVEVPDAPYSKRYIF